MTFDQFEIIKKKNQLVLKIQRILFIISVLQTLIVERNKFLFK